MDNTSFTQIYDTLPQDAQRALFEKYLVPLLENAERNKAVNVVKAAKDMQSRYASMPILDIRAKDAEIEGLIAELDRDAKRSFVKERSVRDELLQEIMDTLTSFVNDIWSVVFEYQVNFDLAHRCLLVAADVIAKLAMPTGGCKCSTMNLYVSTVIKKQKTRKVVKSFQLTGVPSFDKVLLWVWRDLFLSMLASRPEKAKTIPQMLQDIQDVMGWTSLERLLLGGKTMSSEEDDEAEDDLEDDFGDETDAEDEEGDGDEDAWIDEDDDDYLDHVQTCPFHADHWPRLVDHQVPALREAVHSHLISHFRVAPSLALYAGIRGIAASPLLTRAHLLKLTQENALASSDNFVAALDIFSAENNSDTLWSLVQRGSHLLRPRDAPSFQLAATTIAQNRQLKPSSLGIVQKELLDTARALRAALLQPFSLLPEAGPSDELEKILKIPSGSLSRPGRIEAWVNSITTPGTQPTHPMAFAAMMMGIPIPGGAEELGDPDPMGFLELDKNDPDFEDLRDEMKPRLKDRFEGWVETASAIGTSTGILFNVYKELSTMMPFLRASDIVEEMLSRLSDKPSKHHVCDALEALHSFVKAQRKKAIAAVEKQKRKEKAASKAASSKNAAVGPSGSGSSRWSAPRATPPVSSGPPPSDNVPVTYGGIEDVD
ncbi:hypothetical protein BV25DRAFT_1918554 [Artomyces pyxidatus]|uniref:Uncharacterized protein n=1 Tax=Artomyces pyxidatus TaxID=48021 RepID=A0ACB8STN3_9AGAM|nr:hypothetical protein BV25DRAFT_1918554 [Artomyces pyxidatus]